MENLKIEYIETDKLKAYDKNTRKHADLDVRNIAKSIEKYGFNDPIGVYGKDNLIVEGHGRLLAAKRLGMDKVPCVRLDHMTDTERREYAIAHNATAELSEWDFEILDDEIADLDLGEFDFGFLDEDEEQQTEIIEDEAPEVDEENEPTCKLGDIWQLGRHRLMCGDSTDRATVKTLMNGEMADLYLTDPPYNVNYEGSAGKIKNDHFGSDEECGKKLWLPAFSTAREFSKDECSVYCFMPQGGTHMMMMMMMSRAGWQVKHELIWLKQSIVLNRADYNYQHEPFLFGWNRSHTFYGNGKYKNTSVWQIDRPTKSKDHPTMKPVELFAEILNNSTKKDDIVLDTFCGSGTTFIACEELNRTCYGVEIEPKYCDVIIKRWENLTGQRSIKIN